MNENGGVIVGDVESNMKENPSHDCNKNHHHHQTLAMRNRSGNIHRFNSNDCRKNGSNSGGDDGDKDDYEDCDVEAWQTLSESFNQVQSVLDQNRVLIQQVNENHQSRIPDNLAKNVSLIREINGNISKIISLYSHLSVNFSNIVHQRRAMATASKNNGDGNDCSDVNDVAETAE
ncbi:hypothetical protein Ancab_011429 [Ancistrocladus abbreviatus]